MSTVETEQVLVVPTRLFHKLGYFQGFSADVARYIPQLLSPESTRYLPRGEMETNPDFKQLIPYVLFEYESPDGLQLFRYTRGNGQGESRLHAKQSVGIGGHISSLDNGAESIYAQGMERELSEEVLIETPYSARLAGLINDDETEVGRVHLGIVHVFRVDRPSVRAREADILDAGFADAGSIKSELDRYESWSQICVDALFQIEPATQASQSGS